MKILYFTAAFLMFLRFYVNINYIFALLLYLNKFDNNFGKDSVIRYKNL